MHFFKAINSIVKSHRLLSMKTKELIGSMTMIGRVAVSTSLLGMGKFMCTDKFVHEGSLCGLNIARTRQFVACGSSRGMANTWNHDS